MIGIVERHKGEFDMDLLKWLRPGLGIKRWLFIGIFGVALFAIGISQLLENISHRIDSPTIRITLTVVGIALITLALKKGINSLLSVIAGYKNGGTLSRNAVNQMLYKERILTKGPKIVVIGGGTGLSVLLRGLKEYTSNITAIVTVADDGGGSGILREDLGMLPPGDIRSCILALANTEPTMEKLLQYRFKEGNLKGQNFGNLFIAAMNEIHGNFEVAIKEMSNVLAVKGRVLPMTLEDVKLYAKLINGDVVEGESNIPVKNNEIGSKIDHVYIKPYRVQPLSEAIDAIREADCIVLGPGSLYTSVIPNLLVRNMVHEIDRSQGLKVYIPNIMTQPGETDDYNVLDHVEALLKHTKKNIINYVIANTENIPSVTMEKYSKDGAKLVMISDEQEVELIDKNIGIIKDNLVEIKKNYIRHDANKLSQIIVDLIMTNKMKKDRNIFLTK